MIIALHLFLNMFSVRFNAMLNRISAGWHMLGVLVIVGVLIVIPDVQGTLDAVGFAVPYIWETSMSATWAEFLLFVACVGQLFCGNASVTSASRMLFAFSRDRAVPGHQLWSKVARADRVPVYAVMAICVLAWLLMLPTLANAFIGYLVGTSISVIGLFLAFGLPIVLRYRIGDRFEHGAWSLGRHYRWIDPIAITWIALMCIIFLMPVTPTGIPWNDGFNWEVVNYAPITLGGAFLLFGGWWVVSARRWFKGPIRQGSDEELDRIERGYEEGTPAIRPAGR